MEGRVIVIRCWRRSKQILACLFELFSSSVASVRLAYSPSTKMLNRSHSLHQFVVPIFHDVQGYVRRWGVSISLVTIDASAVGREGKTRRQCWGGEEGGL
jgi:hypothetical protein